MDRLTTRNKDVFENQKPSAKNPAQDTTVRSGRNRRTSTFTGVVVGLVATFAFYLLAPWAATAFAGGPEFVQRYFCGHPLEYITSTMFFVGMGILWVKFRSVPHERRILVSIQQLATEEQWASQTSPQTVLQSLRLWLRRGSSSAHASAILTGRVQDVLHYLGNHSSQERTGSGIEDHLRYLADLASDRLLQSYSLIRTVTWAVPIMGFLGTVVGITMAIANVTPEQLDTSLPEVTSGLAVAFDTTAQALGMSMILVFATFLVERSEQSILNDVEQFGIDHLVPALSSDSASGTTHQGLPALADWTSQMLVQQTEFWNRHLELLQSGWAETLARQTNTLATVLGEETQQTLQLHREGISTARDQYAAVLHRNTQAVTETLQSTLNEFGTKVESWQSAIQASTLAAADQAEELHRLGRTLLQMTESEQRLVQLQDELNRNLQSLQIVETLEQTVSSLNAAVHVLTAKTSFRSAA